MRAAVLAAIACGLLACHGDQRQTRDRGAAQLFDRAPTIEAPESDRCQRMAAVDEAREPCDLQKREFLLALRALSVGDQMCLDNLVGDPADQPGCRARAAIADTASGRLLIEVRGAQPESRWFDKIQSQLWFEEGALLDLFLAERGYLANGNR